MFTGFVIVFCFIIIGMMWTEGLWSNVITFINTIFSGIFAWNFFEPAAGIIEDNAASFTYLAEFVGFWLVFFLAFNVARAVTDQISKTKARFRKPVEMGGAAIFAILTAFVMAVLICTTMHFAPLGKKPFGGGFVTNGKDAGSFLGMKIENIWLSNMARMSKKGGTLATKNTNAFDPTGEFAVNFYKRRAELEEYNDITGSVRYDKSKMRNRR